MQQRQLRLGDILDDYCPRERRVTNHAVVAMVGEDVKQTRCTTCDCDHEYKHAKIPRQRRKTETPAALYAQVLAKNGPKRVAHEGAPASVEANAATECEPSDDVQVTSASPVDEPNAPVVASAAAAPAGLESDPTPSAQPHTPIGDADAPNADEDDGARDDDGPVHRPLIRASLPKHEGQAPPSRPIPEFTIRQPGGRPSRFRPRHQRGPGGPGGGGGQQFQGNRSNGGSHGGPPRGGMRPSGGRPPQAGMPTRLARRNGPGRKRSK
jgi:translation initiation factor IF-2